MIIIRLHIKIYIEMLNMGFLMTDSVKKKGGVGGRENVN